MVAPLSFEPNVGQAEKSARFVARGPGYSVRFTEDGAVLTLAKRSNRSHVPRSETLRMRLSGSTVKPAISGEGTLPGTVNYFVGHDASRWRTGLPTFRKVKYSEVYPGVDLVFHGNQQALEFDFVLQPGANSDAIRFHLAGAQRLDVDTSGALRVVTSSGEIRFAPPLLYQLGPQGQKQRVTGGFHLLSRREVGFRVGSYDRSKRLVIDPILSYSTYFGLNDWGTGIAVDAAGNAYVTGWTSLELQTTNGGLPTTPGAIQPSSTSKQLTQSHSAFVTKFNSSGTAILYSTYLSGGGDDEGDAIAVDGQGNAYVTGTTTSIDFPVTAGALETVNRAAPNGTAFISKLNATGTALVYSTYFGGSKSVAQSPLGTPFPQEIPSSIAVDTAGAAYVTGMTNSADLPSTGGAFQPVTKSIQNTGFVAKLNSSGSALAYCSYLGGSASDQPNSAALDSAANLYVVGSAYSVDFPVTGGAFQTTNRTKSFANPANYTGFITKVNPNGTALVYSTYLGGTVAESVNGIAVDQAGEAYVVGDTDSHDFPVTPGVLQTTMPANSEYAFVSRLNSSGTGLIFSTLLGGLGENSASSIVLDPAGNPVVAGGTNALNFPLTSNAYQTQNTTAIESDDSGSFVTKLNSSGTALLYSTYLGGSGDLTGERSDAVHSIAIDPAGDVFLTGSTVSTDFPVTPGAFQALPAGVFVTKFTGAEMTVLPATTTTVTSDANPQAASVPVHITTKVTGTSGSVPTGSIGVSVNGDPWSNYILDNTGSITYATSTLPGGPDTIVTHYLGDTKNAPSTNYFQQSITAAPTDFPVTVTVLEQPNPVAYGSVATFDVTVTDPSGKGQPEGTVSLNPGGIKLGYTVQLDGSGHAVLTTDSLPPGTTTMSVDFFSSNSAYASGYGSVNLIVTPIGTMRPPTISPAGGTYTTQQTLTLTDSEPAARIYYTLDGSPVYGFSPEYTGPITLSSSATVTAIASKDGYVNSSPSSAVFLIGLKGTLPVPTFSPSPGTYAGSVSVQITDSVPAALIYYTTDGTTPIKTPSELYSPGLTLKSSATVKAIAVAFGYLNSSVSSAAYTVTSPASADFAISAAPASMTVAVGHSGQTTISVSGVNGFAQSVALTCTGVPAGASCSFSPATLSPGSATAVLTVTVNSLASLRKTPLSPARIPVLAFGLWLGAVGLRKRRRERALLCAIAASGAVLFVLGCGSGTQSSSSVSPVATTFTVTGTSGALVHSVTVPLTENPS